MKKLFGAVIVGTMVFGAVLVSASSLSLTGGTIQAGSISVSCQTNPLKVGYTTQVNGSGVNEVVTVTLSGVDPACQGKWADIALITTPPPYGSGVSATNLWGTLDLDSSTTFAIPGLKPLSSDIYTVHVQIKDV